NLAGDFKHVSTVFPVVDAGEPFLRTFNNRFQFTEEYGRLEHAVIPIYYRLKKMKKKFYSFHFSNIRPPLRIMDRHCYLDWRETMNTASENIRKKYASLQDFRKAWMEHNFKTMSEDEAKFRYARFIASMVEAYEPSQIQAYPQVIKEMIE